MRGRWLPGVRGWLAFALMAPLAGCLPQTTVPVAERSPVELPAPEVYIVHRDDTLYAIAWRHNLDFRMLAQLNGLTSPYVIQPGSRIRLAPKPRPVEPPASQPVRRPAPPQTVPEPIPDTQPAPEPQPTPGTQPVATSKPTPAAQPKPTAPAVERVQRPAPKAVAKPTPAPTPVAQPAPAKPSPKPPKPAAAPTTRPGGWRAPVAAKPVRGFGNGSKGFDYALPPGTLIHAASSGAVVYAGPGLGGFRHLVIVKRSERHLVAYGVNVPPALREGDKVNVGDTVARTTAGSTAGDFHFEIRDQGKPVNPGSLVGG